MLTIVVYHCSLLFLVFLILIVLVVRTLYSLCRAPIVRPLVIVSNCSHSFCAVCSTTLYRSMCRTIDPTCISSILCTPWFTSSLNCVPDITPCLLCLTQTFALSILHLLDVSICNLVLFIMYKVVQGKKSILS